MTTKYEGWLATYAVCKETVSGWDHQQSLTLHRAAWHIRCKAVGRHRWLQHGGSTVILQPLCCHPQADYSVPNKQKAHEMRSKAVTRVFCFHQHETLPVWISSFPLDKPLGSAILWHAQIRGFPLLSSATGTKCRSDTAQLLATKLTGAALKRPPAAKLFTTLLSL